MRGLLVDPHVLSLELCACSARLAPISVFYVRARLTLLLSIGFGVGQSDSGSFFSCAYGMYSIYFRGVSGAQTAAKPTNPDSRIFVRHFHSPCADVATGLTDDHLSSGWAVATAVFFYFFFSSDDAVFRCMRFSSPFS